MNIEDILQGVQCPIYPSQPFGLSLGIDRPGESDGIIIMINCRGGLIPRRLLLPHQFYLDDLGKLIKEESQLDEVIGVPIRAAEYRTIWKRGNK